MTLDAVSEAALAIIYSREPARECLREHVNTPDGFLKLTDIKVPTLRHRIEGRGEFQIKVTTGRLLRVREQDEEFCRILRAAIEQGHEFCPIGVSTELGTKKSMVMKHKCPDSYY